MTAIQQDSTIVLKYGFGLRAPNGSEHFGWEYLPTLADQLRYLGEHKGTKPDTVYVPIVVLFLEENFADGPGWVPIMSYQFHWSAFDLEAIDNGNAISKVLTGATPRPGQLRRRPVHMISDIPIGMCQGDCGCLLDGVKDSDDTVCTTCWDNL